MEATLELRNGFCEVTQDELRVIDGGMAPAFLYALGFIASAPPLAVCIGIGLVLVGIGFCIYEIATR